MSNAFRDNVHAMTIDTLSGLSERVFLAEEMTFDQLFRMSEPKRVKRALTVRGPPLEINGNSDAVYHIFNFKSFPSTTGLRHHGYIKFKKPRLGERKRLQHIPCEVDCTCPDYRYRWAWVNKQKGAGRVGPQSMNQCFNRRPRITNPDNIPGLCKHILAARDYIYGMLATFPSGEPDTGEKLAQMVKYAEKRWVNFDTLMAKAKDQEKWFAAVKKAANQGRAGDIDLIYDLYQREGGKFTGIPAGVPPRGALPIGQRQPPGEEPPPLPAPLPPAKPTGPVLPAAGKPTAQPLAVPPGERGRTMPLGAKPPAAPLAVPPGERGRQLPVPPPPKNNLPIGRKKGRPGGTNPPPNQPPRRESLDFPAARVSIGKGSSDGANIIESMKLNEAIKLIEEIEHDEVEAPSAIAGEMAAADAPPPSEPPVSDDAIGADTEGNIVIQLLADIKDLISTLVGAEEGEEFGPEGELPPGEGELPPGEGEPEEGGEEHLPVDAIPEPDEEEEEEEEGVPPHHAPEGERD